MKKQLGCGILLSTMAILCTAQNNASLKDQASRTPSTAEYRNPDSFLIDAKVESLLSRMTIEEKVGQLEIPLGWEMYRKSGDSVDVSDQFKKMMQATEPGSLYGVLRADPWTKITLQTGLSPRQSAEATNAVQKYAIEHSRLHIPLLLAEECPHGHMALGATVFPTSIGQSTT